MKIALIFTTFLFFGQQALACLSSPRTIELKDTRSPQNGINLTNTGGSVSLGLGEVKLPGTNNNFACNPNSDGGQWSYRGNRLGTSSTSQLAELGLNYIQERINGKWALRFTEESSGKKFYMYCVVANNLGRDIVLSTSIVRESTPDLPGQNFEYTANNVIRERDGFGDPKLGAEGMSVGRGLSVSRGMPSRTASVGGMPRDSKGCSSVNVIVPASSSAEQGSSVRGVFAPKTSTAN